MIITDEGYRVAFEAWYSEEYAWEMKRSAPGRGGVSLKQYNGEYVSDRTKNDFKVWCAAMKRMQQ